MWVGTFITQRLYITGCDGCERIAQGIRKCQHDPDGRLFHGGVRDSAAHLL